MSGLIGAPAITIGRYSGIAPVTALAVVVPTSLIEGSTARIFAVSDFHIARYCVALICGTPRGRHESVQKSGSFQSSQYVMWLAVPLGLVIVRPSSATNEPLL